MVFERGARFLARSKRRQRRASPPELYAVGPVSAPCQRRCSGGQTGRHAALVLSPDASERTAERPRKTDADRRGGKGARSTGRTGRPQSLIAQLDSDVLSGCANAPPHPWGGAPG